MRTSALLLFLASASLAAQTARTPIHHTGPVHRTVFACAALPEISLKIPALPPGTPCARALYTITRHPDFSLDYVSPLVSPELRAQLDAKTSTFSLDYIDTHIGTGPLALPHKWYTVKYTGYLPDGSIFDSSEKHGGEPISFPYGSHRVIEGWDSGFEGMHIGGTRRLFIPYQLAYGENGHPPVIPAKAMLVFDVELIAQSDTQPTPPHRPAPERPVVPQHAPMPAPGAKPGSVVGGTAPSTSTAPAQPSATEKKQ